jgi:hypothetical protein
MSAEMHWLATLLATDTPALPGAGWMRIYLPLSWVGPLCLLGALLGWKLPLRARRIVAAAFGVVAAAGGSAFPTYWLGLAFQSLSWSTVLLSGLALASVLADPTKLQVQPETVVSKRWPLGVAVLSGALLLLDTFAVLPWELYAWGFSPMALLCLLALSLLPGVLHGFTFSRHAPEVWVAPCALLLFAVTRLPTGNVWDALMDPWLWLFLTVAALRALVLSRRAD